MARRISVDIVGDSSSLERAFKRSSNAASTFNRNLTRGAKGISGTFSKLSGTISRAFGPAGMLVGLGAGAGIGAFVSKTIDAASDLNEQLNRSNVVFGKSSASIEAWSKTTADALGIAQSESLEAAGSFGGMFRVMGIAEPKAAAMSKTLVTLAADMASFNNEDPSDMLDRLRSGLAGEAEPLRRFQVLLSEARVKQEAYRSGIAKVGADLTEQQKVQARYNLILKDTALQQGDFARTSDSWANVQRRLSALLEDTAAKIGALLLPKLTDLANRFADWIAQAENQQRVVDVVEDIGRKLQAVAGFAQNAISAWNRFIAFLQQLKLKFQQFWNEMLILNQQAFLKIIEPFSHLPSAAGNWAREMKEQALAELGELEAKAIAIAANISGTLAGVGPRGAPGAPNTLRRLREQHRKERTETKNHMRTMQSLLSGAGGKVGPTAAELASKRREAAERARERAEKAAEARATAQFKLLGFGPGGADLIPGVRALRRQLENVRDKVAGSFLDTKKTRSLISHIRTVLSGQLGQVGQDVRRKIQEILADLNRQLGDAKGATATKFQKISAQAFLASIGITLTPEELRRFRLKFSQLGPGNVLPRPTSQFAGQMVVAGNVNLYGVQDVKGFETELTKRSKQRAHMRRSTR